MDLFPTLSILSFGFGLGLKHAIEADHVAAVSTIVTQRKKIWSSSIVGGLWGVGHTFSLLAAGILVILFHVEISERTEQTLEFCVALMLIVLGLDALRRLILGGQSHSHAHTHDGHVHAHPHIHEQADAHECEAAAEHKHIGLRPLVVGMIHGLAGSGAVMLLVLATISSPAVGLAYIAIFGIGSIGGMMLMSLLLGLPMLLAADRFKCAESALRGMAGLFSLGLGIFMVYEIGFVDGLFGK